MKKLNLTKNIFGIDLGTTNSAIGLKTSSATPKLIPLRMGKVTIPSCVMWHEGQFIVGEEAYLNRYKSNVAYSVKRLMGSEEVITLTDDDGSTLTVTPIEISAEILKELCRRAEIYAGKVNDVVITVPAYFTQAQIRATLKAGELAGLTVHRIVKEPTAACYVYRSLDSISGGNIVVYDLGGGTFDVTHLHLTINTPDIAKQIRETFGIVVSEDAKCFSRVIGTYGNSKLGGDDIDHIAATLLKGDISLTSEEYEQLTLKCEQVKKLFASTGGSMDCTIGGHNFTITSDIIKQATRQVYDETKKIMAPLGKQINTIVLVGGSTKSTFIREWLKEDFPFATINCGLNPDETVALGASTVAGELAAGACLSCVDVLPLAISVKAQDTLDICLPTNTGMPFSTKRYYTTVQDNQTFIDLELYQGLSEKPSECIPVGSIHIDGLPPAPVGELKIEVAFILTMEGLLKVTATVAGQSKSIDITDIFSPTVESTIDDFEKMFMPDNPTPEILSLFEKRREPNLSEEERHAIEGQIIMGCDL